MPYIGRSLGDGVRARYIYAATSGQTTFSGNDANGIALAYSDTLYMDVYQNGVLLKPVTDYASTTGTSVVLTTGASTDDVVEMIVYDSFAVADTVSAANGGTFSGNMAMGGTLGVTGAATLSSTLAVTDDANFDSGTLFVDASANRVGIGTTSPSQLLSIVDTNARMEVISSVGGTSVIDMGTTSDADAAGVRYASGTGAMSFRANGDERMRIDSSGKVGIGTSSPSAHLQVETSANSPVLIKSTYATGGYVQHDTGANGANIGYVGCSNALVNTGGTESLTDFAIRSQGNLVFSTGGGTERMRLTSTGALRLLALPSGAGNADLRVSTTDGGVSFDTSSRLVKENIVDCPYGLAEVVQLQPRKYLRTDDEAQEVGFIADEVSEILPEFVPMMPRSVFTKKDEDTDLVAGSVNYSKLTAVLTKAIQEQQATITAQQSTITALETKQEALEARISALEAGE